MVTMWPQHGCQREHDITARERQGTNCRSKNNDRWRVSGPSPQRRSVLQRCLLVFADPDESQRTALMIGDEEKMSTDQVGDDGGAGGAQRGALPPAIALLQ
jgi:hypothetical protein